MDSSNPDFKTELKKIISESVAQELAQAKKNIVRGMLKHERVGQIQLISHYQSLVHQGLPLPKFSDTGFRIFSQFEEDGLILFALSLIQSQNKTFIDIGSADGVYSNCANLAINHGWHGLFIDGDPKNIESGQDFYGNHRDTWLYPPIFKHAFIQRENINDLIANEGFRGNVGFVSIDLDGNDYWIWDALNVVNPDLVVIETHIELGDAAVTIPYQPDFTISEDNPDYFGASGPAMVKLGKKKGYRLVGSNRFGFNLFFVKNGVAEKELPEVPLASCLNHHRYQEKKLPESLIETWDLVEV
jgi:hypothetical protein